MPWYVSSTAAPPGTSIANRGCRSSASANKLDRRLPETRGGFWTAPLTRIHPVATTRNLSRLADSARKPLSSVRFAGSATRTVVPAWDLDAQVSMNQAAAKRFVLLALQSVGQAAEPAVLAEATSLPLDHVMWVLDRLRDEERVRCRVVRGREWWEPV
jgi:hypothetical protein